MSAEQTLLHGSLIRCARRLREIADSANPAKEPEPAGPETLYDTADRLNAAAAALSRTTETGVISAPTLVPALHALVELVAQPAIRHNPIDTYAAEDTAKLAKRLLADLASRSEDDLDDSLWIERIETVRRSAHTTAQTLHALASLRSGLRWWKWPALREHGTDPQPSPHEE